MSDNKGGKVSKSKMSRFKRSPMRAVRNSEIVRLQTDNWSAAGGWIMIDGNTVILSQQKNGEPATGSVKFSRRDFNRLVAWYRRPQRLHRKDAK